MLLISYCAVANGQIFILQNYVQCALFSGLEILSERNNRIYLYYIV